MPLKRPSYEVYLPTQDTPLADGMDPDHIVMVTHSDQLRAELEARKYKLPPMTEAPLHATTLWVWAAMVREGLTDLTYPDFKAVGVELQPVKGGDGKPELTDEDPTRLGLNTG